MQLCVAVMGEKITSLYSNGNVFISTVLLLALMTRLCVMYCLVEHNHGCRVMEPWPHCNTLQTFCNTLQHSATHIRPVLGLVLFNCSHGHATHCSTLQHSATLCNMLESFVCEVMVTHCNTLQHLAPLCDTKLHTSNRVMGSCCLYSHGHTMQHNATQCNTVQHTATSKSSRHGIP